MDVKKKGNVNGNGENLYFTPNDFSLENFISELPWLPEISWNTMKK